MENFKERFAIAWIILGAIGLLLAGATNPVDPFLFYKNQDITNVGLITFYLVMGSYMVSLVIYFIRVVIYKITNRD